MFVSKGVRWFTNLEHKKRHEDLILYKYYYGNEKDYPKYDNYDAINVDKTADIPCDYFGNIGVPITFLDKYNPEQFEILKFRKGNDNKDLTYISKTDNVKKTPYFRIIIRQKQKNLTNITEFLEEYSRFFRKRKQNNTVMHQEKQRLQRKI